VFCVFERLLYFQIGELRIDIEQEILSLLNWESCLFSE